MIEVEKKFILTSDQEKKLIKGADFLGEKKFTDRYYDDAVYSLTVKDTWLRQRDGKFELKVPLNESIEKRVSDQYKELNTEDEIIDYLGGINTNIKDFLTIKGYLPFCAITTTRRKYQKEGLVIDLDIIDFGYTLAEIEYMVEDVSKINEATNTIIEFAKKYGITSNNAVPIRGKVVEYLRINNPKHFNALIDSKVIK